MTKSGLQLHRHMDGILLLRQKLFVPRSRYTWICRILILVVLRSVPLVRALALARHRIPCRRRKLFALRQTLRRPLLLRRFVRVGTLIAKLLQIPLSSRRIVVPLFLLLMVAFVFRRTLVRWIGYPLVRRKRIYVRIPLLLVMATLLSFNGLKNVLILMARMLLRQVALVLVVCGLPRKRSTTRRWVKNLSCRALNGGRMHLVRKRKIVLIRRTNDGVHRMRVVIR